MLGRLVPLIGTLLMSRATRKVAGRNAGKLALAYGAYELWRNYKRSKAPAVRADTGYSTTSNQSRSRHRRRR